MAAGIVAADIPVPDDGWSEIEPVPARRLLIAAVEAFAARGYHATTTRDIASRAGLSPAGVYVHYRSKEELLFRISLIGHQRCLRMVVAAAAASDEPEARLRAVIGDFAAWHARHRTTARVVQYEHEALTPDHQAEIVRLRRDTEAVVRETLRHGVARGVFDVPDIPGTALAMLSSGIDVARWYRPSHARTPDDVGRLYADLAARTVRRVPPP